MGQHLKGQPEKTRKAAVNRNTLHLTNLFSHFRSQKLERYLQISMLYTVCILKEKNIHLFIHHFAWSVLLCILCIRLAYTDLLWTVALHTAVTVEEKKPKNTKTSRLRNAKTLFWPRLVFSKTKTNSSCGKAIISTKFFQLAKEKQASWLRQQHFHRTIHGLLEYFYCYFYCFSAHLYFRSRKPTSFHCFQQSSE